MTKRPFEKLLIDDIDGGQVSKTVATCRLATISRPSQTFFVVVFEFSSAIEFELIV